MSNSEQGDLTKKMVIDSKKSVYSLLAKDDPGNVITKVLLIGKNYDEWSRRMRTAFRAKKKLGLIDGTVTAPATDSKEEDDWLTANSMVVSGIYNTIDPSIRSTIADRKIAKEQWDNLKKRFSVSNEVRVQQMTKELVSCVQGMQKLWEHLKQIEPKSECTCAQRSAIEQLAEKRKLLQFL